MVFLCCTAHDIELQKFVDFTEEYNKFYSSGEERKLRARVFLANLKTIHGLNGGDRFHPYGVNQFSDMTKAEFSNAYLMRDVPTEEVLNSTQEERFERRVADIEDWVGPIPTCFDWRDRSPDVVTDTKDQDNCGSCYAFAAVAQMETVWALQGHHKLVELSTQQLVSCDTNNGCDGGKVYKSMSYVMFDGGLQTASSYPYTSGETHEAGSCSFETNKILARFSGWHRVTRDNPTADDEYDMMVYVYRRGPIAVSINAENLQFYSRGIMSNCGHNYGSTSHVVVLTGFGVSNSGTPYWVVRNSWGPKWGVYGGYFFIERNVNMCGVADKAYAAYIDP